jgi:hypothetical protein
VKQCNVCKETKPLEQFTKNKVKKDNLKNLCRACSKIKRSKYYTTPRGRSAILLGSVRFHTVGKRANLEKTLTREDIIPALETGKCQLTGLPFDFNPTTTRQNPYAPSLDRIDSQKGYTKDNVRIVLYAVNVALGEQSDEKILPILKAMVKAIEKNVNKKPTTPVPTGTNSSGEVYPELGPISTTGPWKNSDDPDDHSRAIRGKDTDHSTQEGSGDGLGGRGKEVEPPQTFKSCKGAGQSCAAGGCTGRGC